MARHLEARDGRARSTSRCPTAPASVPRDTLPVYRFFNNRRDANHRYTVDLSVRRAMINRAWVPEGTGSEARGVLLVDLTPPSKRR